MQPRDRLTNKEVQVAILVWEGMTNREIAGRIGTTEQVVKNCLRNTFDKLGVWSRLELALYVAGHGGSRWRDPLEDAAASLTSRVETHTEARQEEELGIALAAQLARTESRA